MLTFLGVGAFSMLFMGFPFVVILLALALLLTLIFVPDFNLMIVVQQVVHGFLPPALLCVPMFILAAEIITRGEAGDRLINLVKAYLGHLPGGIPICTIAACTLFGSVSGSTQATVAAIGRPFRPLLLQSGYSSSFSLALIINASDIAWLIPPSIGLIVYGVANSTSIGQLFLAGIGPGVLIFVMFSIFCFFYSKFKKIGTIPSVSWHERWGATRKGGLLLGFPIIILGGIYTGIFSPTEASAASVAYALFLEGVVYRKLSIKHLRDALLFTGVITAVCFILVGGGQILSYILSYLQIPQAIMPLIFGPDPSALKVIVIINIAYFVGCMFMGPVVLIFVLSPIFLPYVAQAGVNHVLLGTLVTLQGAIGSATPPFGCDIFSAQMIFRRPYFEIIRETPVFVFILLLVAVTIVAFPDIALFLPSQAFGLR